MTQYIQDTRRQHGVDELPNKKIFIYTTKKGGYDLNNEENDTIILSLKPIDIDNGDILVEDKKDYGYEIVNGVKHYWLMGNAINEIYFFATAINKNKEKIIKRIKVTKAELDLMHCNIEKIFENEPLTFFTIGEPFSNLEREKLFQMNSFEKVKIVADERYYDEVFKEEEKYKIGYSYSIVASGLKTEETLSVPNLNFIPTLIEEVENKENPEITFDSRSLITNGSIFVEGTIKNKNTGEKKSGIHEVVLDKPMIPLKIVQEEVDVNYNFYVEWFDQNTALNLKVAKFFESETPIQNLYKTAAGKALGFLKEDVQLIEDMILICAGYNSGWKDSPRYTIADIKVGTIFNSDVGKIKANYRLGYSNWPIQSFAEGSIQDVINSMYQEHTNKNPTFSASQERTNLVHSLMAALGQYISHETLTIGNFSKFNEAFLPFFLQIKSSISLSGLGSFDKDGTPNKEKGKIKHFKNPPVLQTATQYFKSNFTNQLSSTLKNEIKLCAPNSFNASNKILIEAGKKFTIPKVPDELTKRDVSTSIGDVTTVSDEDLNDIVYIPLSKEEDFAKIYNPKPIVANFSLSNLQDFFFSNHLLKTVNLYELQKSIIRKSHPKFNFILQPTFNIVWVPIKDNSENVILLPLSDFANCDLWVADNKRFSTHTCWFGGLTDSAYKKFMARAKDEFKNIERHFFELRVENEDIPYVNTVDKWRRSDAGPLAKKPAIPADPHLTLYYRKVVYTSPAKIKVLSSNILDTFSPRKVVFNKSSWNRFLSKRNEWEQISYSNLSFLLPNRDLDNNVIEWKYSFEEFLNNFYENKPMRKIFYEIRSGDYAYQYQKDSSYLKFKTPIVEINGDELLDSNNKSYKPISKNQTIFYTVYNVFVKGKFYHYDLRNDNLIIDTGTSSERIMSINRYVYFYTENGKNYYYEEWTTAPSRNNYPANGSMTVNGNTRNYIGVSDLEIINVKDNANNINVNQFLYFYGVRETTGFEDETYTLLPAINYDELNENYEDDWYFDKVRRIQLGMLNGNKIKVKYKTIGEKELKINEDDGVKTIYNIKIG